LNHCVERRFSLLYREYPGAGTLDARRKAFPKSLIYNISLMAGQT
jgi:hypothetical protein